VSLAEPQRNGESLSIAASNTAGELATVTIAVPDTQAPAPVSELRVSDDGAQLSGLGEAGATVTVRDANGAVLGSAPVQDDGRFSVTLDPAQTNGQVLAVEQRDGAGNLSAPLTVQAPDSEAPEPVSALVLSADGGVLTGQGEPGTTVTVRSGAAVIGTALVAEDGSFRVTLTPAQLNGQTLSVTLTDGGNNVSSAIELLAPDLQAPASAEDLQLNAEGTVLSGSAEAGTTVEVRDPQGGLLGNALVAADGRFEVSLPAQTNGEVLTVVVIDGAGYTSPPISLTAEDATAPLAPENVQVNANGSQLVGTGEVGSTVTVRNAAGEVVGTGDVPAGGLFVINLSPPQDNAQSLQVTLTDAQANTSQATTVIAPTAAAPDAPSDVSVSLDGATVSGTAVGAVSVTVRDANGAALVTVQVQADGSFTALLPTPLSNGEPLSVVATDSGGRVSIEQPLNAPDTTPPEAALNVAVSADGSRISGSAEPGSTVLVRNGSGELGSVRVGTDGSFVVRLDPLLLTGDSAEVVVIDAAGNENPEPVQVFGPPSVPVDSPSELVLSLDGFSLSGVGMPGTQITVTAGGQALGSASVGSDGAFLVFLSSAQLNGQTLQVSAQSAAGVVSDPASLTARDITAPDAPMQLRVESDGSALSGRGERGATVSVRDASGRLLGSGEVDDDGRFSLLLDPAPRNGETLQVSQVDAAGNLSLVTTATAPDLTPPDAATGLALNAAATVLSGQGEAGASVTVRDANGAVLANGTVNQAGQFQITLPAAQVSGAPLHVTLADRAGNTSEPAEVATPDRTPPLAVTQLSLSADGSQLSGAGEAGAMVRVRTPDGTVVGSIRVADDGLFTIILTPAQNAGLTLGVTQVDAAGNVSAALTLVTPDLQPPAALSNVTLNNDGLTLHGLGQAGNTVRVSDQQGKVIGIGQVAANGTFVLTLDTPQLNAERLSAVQSNPGGIPSVAVAVTAPDLTPPAAPTELMLTQSGLQLSGRSEPNSTVEVRNAAGERLGTTVADANGTFRIDLDTAQLNGEALQVTARDAAGNVSLSAPFAADDVTPPEPVSHLALSADGITLTGHGEVGAKVTVTGIEGAFLGDAVVDAQGHFSVRLDPPAVPGLALSVVQVDTGDNPSLPATLEVPAIAPPDTPSQLLLAEDGLSLGGVASPGSTVRVYGPNGLLLGSAEVQADGNFTVSLTSRQANGEVLEVSAEGIDGSLSLPTTVQAPDLIAPQPVTQLLLSNSGLVLSGNGEIGATVRVTGNGGIALGDAVVGTDGRFSVTLETAQLNGERLSVEQVDVAGNISDSISLVVADRTAPDAPADLQFGAGGSVLLGIGEAGTRVTVMAADGALLGSATVRDNGTFEVALTPVQANGETVHVVLTDAAGNRSTGADLTALDTTAPAILSEVTVSSDGVTLTGRGEIGAVVTVRNAANQALGTATVDSSGNFTLALSPALSNAEVLTLTQADAAGNVSPPLSITTPDFTPLEPLTLVRISVDGSVVTGRGEPGATVTVRDAMGQELGRGLVQADETFRVELSPAQINQQVLDVQQADPPGNLSEPVQVIAPDRTPPLAPDNLSLNAAGNQLSGTGEIGTTVRVSVGGQLIGTGTVAADGRFLVQLDAPQLNGEQLSVSLEDASQNVSLPTSLLALDVTPPAQVLASLNADGTQVTGSGEAGARITVVNNLGNLLARGVIDSDGRFVLDLSTPQQNGEVLHVVAQDATGNPSTPLLLTARDLTPPEPLLNLSLNAGGTLLTGNGEVGATVTVRGADGSVLGSVTVPASGAFSVPIAPAQANGQTLTIIATDAAGNSGAA
ncbi:Ig-like domain-containing protein, partial [Pseudomonas sp.]|uniref:Ig-like domain-containing protein n=1 Tax=Pseudomonas sp. TaxID=306 RepID=UPI0028AAC907